ncbi:hypothetical protein JRQ81_017353 [Phrynocephalus forsythii]|uniref:Uncharacterized protein n=1 Tax=Phrynocephalus forsythii TaxID=171643 RepID=A0A9Q0XQU3_9SAUR|nr:hypothetical protein JRQ81_017353 [Phrynocephalus forsythii]
MSANDAKGFAQHAQCTVQDAASEKSCGDAKEEQEDVEGAQLGCPAQFPHASRELLHLQRPDTGLQRFLQTKPVIVQSGGQKLNIGLNVVLSRNEANVGAVNATNEAVQQVVDEVTEAGQKVVDDVCQSAQDAGEKVTQDITSQVTSWGKCFGQSEEKKNVST